ncbi:DUF6173 family protein [Cytobacillus sp. IB215665]|uniref:DUF6173 family protein n=1 Tax=Cytobacillus sp. IB215665 TaxID=3097357 RepID=UPI002A110FF5|nr:DUF6173 family protein [Cytobacillus sp. IB215665]MDX8366792.1 DUF6173 family protein [Cytobacillus sp. IB215665]
MNNFPSIKFKDYAGAIAEDILSSVNEYNRQLDNEHEAGVMLASFGQTITVSITGVGNIGAKLVKFTGNLADTGAPAELIQHVSQLNFLLVALRRENPEEPKKQIGFIQE